MLKQKCVLSGEFQDNAMRWTGNSTFKMVVVLFLISVLTTSCVTTRARERAELTEKYGLEIENVYYQHMLARVKACQTKETQGLDAFAEGHYLELLKKRVEDSECYPTEPIEQKIEDVTINRYSSGELEAVIGVQVNGKQYIWLCTFREVNGTWKVTSIRVPPWS